MEFKTRADVPEKYQADLTKLFKDTAAWNKEYELVNDLIDEIKDLKKNFLDNRDNLKKYLSFNDKLIERILKLECYTYFLKDEDLGNTENIMLYDKAMKLSNKYCIENAFFASSVTNKSENYIYDLINCEELKNYHFYFEQLFRNKAHYLNEADETMITKLTKNNNSFEEITSTLLNSSINYGSVMVDGKETEITTGNCFLLLKNKDELVRKQVYEQFYGAIKNYENIFSKCLLSYLENCHENALLHHFSGVKNESFYEENVSEKVNTILHQKISDNVNLLQDYFKIVAKKLGKGKLNYYDLSAKIIDFSKKYEIEEAEKLVLEAVKPLGCDYQAIINQAFKERWIDYCTYKGKCSGAYSLSSYGMTSLILTNYNYHFEDVSTIAHELGHAAHAYLSNNNNPIYYADHELILAEIASLTNEVLLSDYLANNEKIDKEERITGIINIIEVINSNLFGAGMEGEFENIVHDEIKNGNVLSADFFNEVIINLKHKYYGDIVKDHELMCYSWCRRSHYFMPFYLYHYATSICLATYFASEILKGNKKVLEQYIHLLKLGSSKYPLDILKECGIDMEQDMVYDKAFNYYQTLIERLKQLL